MLKELTPQLQTPQITSLPSNPLSSNPLPSTAQSSTEQINEFVKKMDKIAKNMDHFQQHIGTTISEKFDKLSFGLDTVTQQTTTSISEKISRWVFTYFDTERSYGGLYYTGHILLGIFVWLPVTIFGIVTTLLWFLFLVMLFLLIFIPLMIIGIVFMILILVMIKIWFFGKTFMDALIKTINPIIPVPLFIWNIIANTFNGIGKVLRSIGVRMPRLPVVRNPNSYKIKKGVMSIYDIIDLVLRPLKKQALRKIEDNL
jgi:hypothetical protein